MTLDDFQRAIAHVISRNRNRNRNPSDVTTAAQLDAAALADAGFDIHFERRMDGLHEAIVSKEDVGNTRLQWVQAGSQHYFKPILDPDFGQRLSFVDLATNKALAAASRKEARDFVDLRFILTTGIPLWQLVNGAAGKDASITPLGVLNAMRRNASFTPRELAEAGILPDAIDPATGIGRFRLLLEQTDRIIAALPPEAHAGILLSPGEDRLLRSPPSKGDAIRKIEAVDGPAWPRGNDLDGFLLARLIRNFGERGERFWGSDEIAGGAGAPRTDPLVDHIRKLIETMETIRPSRQPGKLIYTWPAIDDDERARREAALALRPKATQSLLLEQWRKRDLMMVDEWERRGRKPFHKAHEADQKKGPGLD